jgi:hypothetical protein
LDASVSLRLLSPCNSPRLMHKRQDFLIDATHASRSQAIPATLWLATHAVPMAASMIVRPHEEETEEMDGS